jgi:hypothetical protein
VTSGLPDSIVGGGISRAADGTACPESGSSVGILPRGGPLRNDAAFQSAFRDSPVARRAGGQGISCETYSEFAGDHNEVCWRGSFADAIMALIAKQNR